MSDQHNDSMPKTGRVNQKLRTRRELLRGARELMLNGEAVTVAAAAKRVGISTATSYRYFSEPTTMQVEAVLEMDLNNSDALIEQINQTFEATQDVTARLVAAQSAILTHVRRHEFPYRVFIAKAHEQAVQYASPQSQSLGHRFIVDIIEQALAPIKRAMVPATYQSTVASLSAICTPEHFFALKDTCGLRDTEIDAASEQTLRALASCHLPS